MTALAVAEEADALRVDVRHASAGSRWRLPRRSAKSCTVAAWHGHRSSSPTPRSSKRSTPTPADWSTRRPRGSEGLERRDGLAAPRLGHWGPAATHGDHHRVRTSCPLRERQRSPPARRPRHPPGKVRSSMCIVEGRWDAVSAAGASGEKSPPAPAASTCSRSDHRTLRDRRLQHHDARWCHRARPYANSTASSIPGRRDEVDAVQGPVEGPSAIELAGRTSGDLAQGQLGQQTRPRSGRERSAGAVWIATSATSSGGVPRV